MVVFSPVCSMSTMITRTRGFSWKQAGIQARGRTVILRKNYRNTRQVAEAAHLLQNLVGLMMGVLPSNQGLQHSEAEEAQLYIEQQRTLCYMGMTRAAEALYLLTVRGAESRFIKELTGKVVIWE